MHKIEKPDMIIELEFIKNSSNPSRIFKSMSDIISSFEILDTHLISSINHNIKPMILLEDIHASILTTWLKQKISEIDDNDIRNLDWKRIVSNYLVKGKYIVVNFLENKTKISDSKELMTLQKDLLVLAETTGIKEIPAYSPIKTQDLLQDMSNIQHALAPLNKGDIVVFRTGNEATKFNLNFEITPESIEEIITKESIENTCDMILKIKKPDYLGESKWEFIHDGKNYNAKMAHIEWLENFRNRKIPILPGDSMRAKVHTIVNYGHDNNVVNIQNNIVEVIEILKDDDNAQISIFQ